MRLWISLLLGSLSCGNSSAVTSFSATSHEAAPPPPPSAPAPPAVPPTLVEGAPPVPGAALEPLPGDCTALERRWRLVLAAPWRACSRDDECAAYGDPVVGRHPCGEGATDADRARELRRIAEAWRSARCPDRRRPCAITPYLFRGVCQRGACAVR